MKRFKKILVVCDEQEVDHSLLHRAMWLAKSNEAAITLAHVIDLAPGELSNLFGSLPSARNVDVEQEMLAFHRNRLQIIAEELGSKGVEVDARVLQGIAFVELIQLILRDGHDLLMKTAGGELETRSVFFSSTDLHIIRKCPCPVWIMKGDEPERYTRLMAAIDPSSSEMHQQALATLILDLASSLATVDNSELNVVSAWRLEGEDALRHSAFAKIPKLRVDEMIEEKRSESENRFRAMISRYDFRGKDIQTHHLKGPAREIIPDFANEHKVDLIVMGTVGRTGISGLIIGNTAEAILNQVSCSIIAVKPPGFELPVRLNGS